MVNMYDELHYLFSSLRRGKRIENIHIFPVIGGISLSKISISSLFRCHCRGQRIEDIYKVENERLFFEVTNLLNITGDMKGRVRQLEHEKQVLIEDMEKLQQQIVPAQPE
jgi:hypothetical protein